MHDSSSRCWYWAQNQPTRQLGGTAGMVNAQRIISLNMASVHVRSEAQNLSASDHTPAVAGVAGPDRSGGEGEGLAGYLPFVSAVNPLGPTPLTPQRIALLATTCVEMLIGCVVLLPSTDCVGCCLVVTLEEVAQQFAVHPC